MGASKVEIMRDGQPETIMDLTGDTITEETAAEGTTFHGADGEEKVGILKLVTVDSELSETSTNPVQNAVVAKRFNQLSDQIANLPSGGSGLTQAQTNALDGMFKVALYDDSKDYAGAYTAFKSAFGIEDSGESGGEEEPDEPTVTTYTITSELVNVTSNNSATSVNEGVSYTATLTAVDGYTLDSVSVLMGGIDITATAYVDGVITIASVTGNVEIVASAVEVTTGGVLPENGLVAYFDLRNLDAEALGTATLPGGGYGLNTATKGSASLYSWGAWVESSNEYGTQLKRTLFIANENTTTNKSFTGDFTFVGLHKGTGFAHMGIGAVDNNMSMEPIYNNSSGSTTKLTKTEVYNEGSLKLSNAYRFNAQRISGDLLEIFVNGAKSYTFDGSQHDDFESWVITNSIGTAPYQDNGSLVAIAVYDRSVTDTEIIEIGAFFKTLEVA